MKLYPLHTMPPGLITTVGLFFYAILSSFSHSIVLGKVVAQEEQGGATLLAPPPEYEYSVELVKDIWPGEDSSKLHAFINYKGKVSFSLVD